MKKNIKILHLVKTPVGATWALRLMRELVNQGVDIHVLMPDGKLVSQYKKFGVKIHLINPGFSLVNPKSFLALRRTVLALQPDIIHSHFVQSTLVMRLALRNIPIPRVFQVPGPLHLEHPVFKNLEIKTSTKYDYWIGTCNWTSNTYIESGISSDRVFTSFYGGDIVDKPVDSTNLRHELKLSNNDIIVGMVAFMYAPKRYLGQQRGLKGHEDLIDALAICRQRGLSVKGVFVGGAWGNADWYERKIRAYGREKLEDNVLFLGTRNDVPDLYSIFDMVVHPSHSENLGGAAESLSLGVPTIATNVGGFPDIVIDHETGWLVPSKNPRALADAIEFVVGDLDNARSVATRGKYFVREKLDVKNTSNQIHQIYNDILSHRGRQTFE